MTEKKEGRETEEQQPGATGAKEAAPALEMEERPATGPEPATGPDDSAPAAANEVKEDFQPFYEKEAKAEARSRAVKSVFLYFLLVILGVGLIGLAVETFLKTSPLRLEITTTVVICFALIGLLWNKITLESKVGLEALAVGVVIALSFVLHAQDGLGLWGLPGKFIPPTFFCLVLAAALPAVWLTWPRFFWPPLALTLVALYAALAPILSFTAGGADLRTFLLGPPFMQGWPIFIRSGYLLVQVVLPLGAVLLLVLQARTLFARKSRTHWGFLYWALSLALASSIGLIGLGRAQQPVFPPLDRFMTQAGLTTAPAQEAEVSESTDRTSSEPEAAGVQKQPALEQDEPETKETPIAQTPEETETTPVIVEEQPALERPVPEAEKTPAVLAPEETKAETAAITDEKRPVLEGDEAPGTQVPEQAEAETVSVTGEKQPAMEKSFSETQEPPGLEPEASGPDQDKAAGLRRRIKSLEAQIQDLKVRQAVQDDLIRSLMKYSVSGTRQTQTPDSSEPSETRPRENPPVQSSETEKPSAPGPTSSEP